jgi:hypothetical protein
MSGTAGSCRPSVLGPGSWSRRRCWGTSRQPSTTTTGWTSLAVVSPIRHDRVGPRGFHGCRIVVVVAGSVSHRSEHKRERPFAAIAQPGRRHLTPSLGRVRCARSAGRRRADHPRADPEGPLSGHNNERWFAVKVRSG